MADYRTLQAAIDAGADNMTALRLNSRNDDSTSNYSTGIDWFFFNATKVASIYSSGNSFLGFGTNAEQLKVNRRDCAVWSEYMETGVIGTSRFLKFRWVGTSYYSSGYQNDPNYQQHYDVFLIDNGQIYLNFYEVPVNTGSGTNSLTCGSENVTFTITAGEPCEYTFTPSDPATGKGWTVEAGRPNLVVNYKTSGAAEFSTTSVQAVASAKASRITWEADTPEGTDIQVFARLSGGQYAVCKNGGAIPGIDPSTPLGGETLYVRAELSTTVQTSTPVLSKLRVELLDEGDDKVVVLNFARGNVNSVQNAVEQIEVTYTVGTLAGLGGPVEPFVQTFVPSGLDPKNDPNDMEHIELAVLAIGALKKIAYRDTQFKEHIEVGVTASGVLTHIDDI